MTSSENLDEIDEEGDIQSSILVQEELLEQVIDYRTRFYENLANDALKILNIQLFVLPISISVISLVITALESTTGDASGSSLSKFVAGIDKTLLYYGVVIATISIMLSFFSYYFARKYSHSQTRFLLRAKTPSLASSSYFEEKNNQVRNFARRISAESLKRNNISNEQEMVDDLTTILDDGHSPIRGTLAVSLLGTLASAILLTVSLVSPVFPQIQPITVLILTVAVVLILYFVALGDALVRLEEATIVLSRAIHVFFEVAVDVAARPVRSHPLIYGPFVLFVSSSTAIHYLLDTIPAEYLITSLLLFYTITAIGVLRRLNID